MLEQIEKVTKATPDVELRVCRRAEIDKTVLHQGDVYLFRVPDAHPRGKELGTRQVAVGTAVGSRHIVDGDGVHVFAGTNLPRGFRVPEWVSPAELLGPVVVSEEAFTLTHPEHAHHQVPAGTWQVTYQADFATRQRVSD